jgi:hypothetical protein
MLLSKMFLIQPRVHDSLYVNDHVYDHDSSSFDCSLLLPYYCHCHAKANKVQLFLSQSVNQRFSHDNQRLVACCATHTMTAIALSSIFVVPTDQIAMGPIINDTSTYGAYTLFIRSLSFSQKKCGGVFQSFSSPHPRISVERLQFEDISRFTAVEHDNILYSLNYQN